MLRIYTPAAPVLWHWSRLAGPDASDFLHRVTTVNVRGLKVGNGARGCFLNAQGKLRAIFTLWNYGDGEYGFEFDGGANDHWKNALFGAIDQYTFAEKMTLVDVSGLECRWLVGPSSLPLEPGATLAIDQEIRLCHHGETDFGTPWITAWGRPARLTQWIDQNFGEAGPITWEELDALRIRAGRPWVDRELTDATVPLEAGLIDAVAQNKGCYPGQEVIEKIVSLGSPARRLVRIEGQGSVPATGAKIFSPSEPPAEVGQLTSVHSDGNRFTALGYVRKIHAKEGFTVRFPESSSEGSIVWISPYA